MTDILIMGLPASGKSSIVKAFQELGYTVLNRDADGGSISDLLERYRALVGHTNVVLDNLNLTIAERKPFIDIAKAAGVDIECHWMKTSFEDCQVNALNRMYDRYGTCFMTPEDIREHPVAKKDDNIFPVLAMFAARKKLDGDKKSGVPSGEPKVAEGFSKVVWHPFNRRYHAGNQKAIILDFDGTLREDVPDTHYPTRIEEVHVLPRRKEILESYKAKGYLILGISTQSGIDKGVVTDTAVRACFEETNRQLGGLLPLENILYCPHHNFPVACYCRKPQAGLGVQAIRQWDLNPTECVYVGDMTTDKTFAARCGFKFENADVFFRL